LLLGVRGRPCPRPPSSDIMQRTLLIAACLLSLAVAPYEWSDADEINTDNDPWTPCIKKHASGETRGFCRLSCTAKWAFAPERMDCPMLPRDALLRRSHSRGLESFQKMSQNSFSKVNSGVSDLGSEDPDTA